MRDTETNASYIMTAEPNNLQCQWEGLDNNLATSSCHYEKFN